MTDKKDIKEIRAEITIEVNDIPDDEEDKEFSCGSLSLFFLLFTLISAFFGILWLTILFAVLFIIFGSVWYGRLIDKSSSLPWWFGGL